MTPNPSDDRETLAKIIANNTGTYGGNVIGCDQAVDAIIAAGFSRGADAHIAAERDALRDTLCELLRLIRVSHPDMGGNHQYSLDHNRDRVSQAVEAAYVALAALSASPAPTTNAKEP